MTDLIYTRDMLLADHDYHKKHEAAGYHLHGGFDAEGRYQSPRTLHRWPAVRAWQESLLAAGGTLLNADGRLLQRESYPNPQQQALLLEHGYGRILWNQLTVTGVIEARGQALAQFPCPDFQSIIVEDISRTATGHLHKGLLAAHGMDEGGDPDQPDIGAHDAMWFAARDAVFGAGAWPAPEIPETIARPEQGREMPGLPVTFEGLIKLLLNVLMIEVRAEAFFSFCCTVFRESGAFVPEKAALATELVERIRTDEAIHVAYLRVVISEMRRFTFRLENGETVAGDKLIDPVWEKLVEWHGVTVFEENRKRTRENLRLMVAENGDEQLLEEVDALDSAAWKEP